ncbi:MAG: MlaD family protein, partial [Planctomycetota bacterium]|nr:MlaD family protein [Planctomycetota bacterium]
MAGRRRTAKMELAIGATMVAAVIILLMMLFVWGGSSSLFGKHYWVVVEMSNVGGLREGAPVKIGGFQIGKVSSIQLRPGATELDIVLGIDENRFIPKGSSGKISTAGLVGDAFLEIIPGRSTERIARADAVGEAERLPSSPVPDFSELLIRVESIGSELNILASHINDILGDDEFRRNVKTITANLVTVSDEATTMLQRGQRVVDNVERATGNIAVLSDTLQGRVERVEDNIVELVAAAKGKVDSIGAGMEEITRTLKERVGEIAADAAAVTGAARRAAENLDAAIGDAGRGVNRTIDDVSAIAAAAQRTVANLDGAIDDVRRGVNRTLGDPQVAGDIKASLANIREATGTFAAKRGEIEAILANLGGIAAEFRETATRVGAIAAGIDPAKVAATVDELSAAVEKVADMVEKIKNDPVLALSVNKAADRIVKAKFDEMAKNQQTRTADDMLREVQRWTNEAM